MKTLTFTDEQWATLQAGMSAGRVGLGSLVDRTHNEISDLQQLYRRWESEIQLASDVLNAANCDAIMRGTA